VNFNASIRRCFERSVDASLIFKSLWTLVGRNLAGSLLVTRTRVHKSYNVFNLRLRRRGAEEIRARRRHCAKLLMQLPPT
jgi:hypothetical protein